jgi:hypothetical protein
VEIAHEIPPHKIFNGLIVLKVASYTVSSVGYPDPVSGAFLPSGYGLNFSGSGLDNLFDYLILAPATIRSKKEVSFFHL